jgi:hypothetical protein
MSDTQNFDTTYESDNSDFEHKTARRRATTPPRKRRRLNKTESTETCSVGQVLFAMTTVMIALKVYEFLYFVH